MLVLAHYFEIEVLKFRQKGLLWIEVSKYYSAWCRTV